ncbi:MAG: RluA family pseudouridine synthase [Candidatus Omnitrophica bacterium]|nr:RluA family pseudouridine synthase [Candidatus Omnitrophota bacterium]
MRQPIPVLYEDDTCVVFDKPAQLIVIPSPRREDRTLTSIVNAQFQSRLSQIKLHPCHRLDRDTSGVILYAKGKKNQQLYMNLFKQRLFIKKYIAFVHGQVNARTGEIKNPIQSNAKPSRRPGQSALTKYKVLHLYDQFSIVEAQPVTGRTNQIRIHFKQKGHPLVGDNKFSYRRDYQLKFKRTALHAFLLEWCHPQTGQKLSVRADWPKDMTSFVLQNT